jgi:uncharacterized protein YacL
MEPGFAAIRGEMAEMENGIRGELVEMKNDIRAIKIDIENHIKPDIKKLAEGHTQLAEKMDGLQRTMDETALDVKSIDNVQALMVHQLTQAGHLHLMDPIER